MATTIPALVETSDPPLATDSDEQFDAKAFPWAASLDPFGQSVSAIAIAARDNAEEALAVALGGDLPPLTGQALKFLRVKADESGAEFAEPLAGFRNAIINGNFDIWQRGTSFSSVDYGADRWKSSFSGSSATQSRQEFTLGQTDVPGEPEYYCRMVVSSVAGSDNYSQLNQPIEGVRTFAGQTVTATFYAKADAAKDIAVEFVQSFGTGGAPSTRVTAIGVTKITLGTTWAKVTVTATLPSISGKTLGTDSNDSLGFTIWFDAGSDFNARTNSLGQQSGTFDISQVQLEPGSVGTPFERRPVGTELALCQRYYFESSGGLGGAFGTKYIGSAAGNLFNAAISFPVSMRANPSLSLGWDVFDNCEATASHDIRTDGATLRVDSLSAGKYRAYGGINTFDAEL